MLWNPFFWVYIIGSIGITIFILYQITLEKRKAKRSGGYFKVPITHIEHYVHIDSETGESSQNTFYYTDMEFGGESFYGVQVCAIDEPKVGDYVTVYIDEENNALGERTTFKQFIKIIFMIHVLFVALLVVTAILG